MSFSRFKVRAQLDGAGGLQQGTVTINRDTGEVIIRPHRKRRVYRTTLAAMSTAACQSILFSEVRERQKMKTRRSQ